MQRLVIGLVAGCLVAGQATQSTPVPRPRIGLVLSGGSALGLTHVGVIKWLEENHIPVDVIGGTSMGGLVGGLYATGHNSEEIEQFVSDIDWTAAFAAGAPFKNLTYRRKEDRRAFPNGIEFGLKGGFKLPSALSPGHGVGLIISEFAAPYQEMRSFDDLPTPFRCVATDMIAGQTVVFRDGPLQIALRATMSLPGIFAPVPDGKMMLVDGAVLNNLPADVVKNEMKPDVLIAVALLDVPAKPEQVSTILGVASRSISVMIDANEKRNMALADIVIAPDLNSLKSTDFNRYEDFIAKGYEAAEAKKRLLLTLKVSDAEWQAYLDARKSKRRPEQITPKFAEVNGTRSSEAKEIASTMVNKPTDPKELGNTLTMLTGDGEHQSASYGFVNRNGVDGLAVNVQQHPFSPPFLNLGINLEGSDAADLRFGFGGRLTFLDAGANGAEWRTDFSVGLENLLSTEYYWRAGVKGWFLAPRAFFSQDREDVFSGNNRIAQVLIRQVGFGGDIGYSAGRFSEFRLGYQFDRDHFSESIGTPLPSAAGALQGVRARWVYDTQDNPLVPRHGIYSTLQAQWNFSVPEPYANFGTVEERFLYGRQLTDRYVLLVSLNGGTTLGPSFVIPTFSLGGPLNVSALAQWQQRGDRYYNGSASVLRSFSTEKLSQWNRTYVALGVEAGKAFTDFSQVLPVYDGVLGFVAETAVGGVFFGGSVGSNGNRKFFFRVGRFF